jgi:hypothetical protein
MLGVFLYFFFELMTSQTTFSPSFKKIDDHQQSLISHFPRIVLLNTTNRKLLFLSHTMFMHKAPWGFKWTLRFREYRK